MLAKFESNRNVRNVQNFERLTHTHKKKNQEKKRKENINKSFKTIFDKRVGTILKDISVAEISV